MLRHASFLGILLLFLSACTNQTLANTDSAPPSLSASVEHDPSVQQLLAGLQQRGIELTSPDSSRVAWLSVAPGLVYRVGPGWLHVHVYPDTSAAVANADQIPADADTGATDWVAPPNFFQCDNIIALYLGQDELVKTALTALCGSRFAGFRH